MNLWDKPSVPHKGWRNVDVIDLNPNNEPMDEVYYATCEMCGHEQIRFVHVMEHDHYDTLKVGCVCAVKMSNDAVGPRAREKQLKSRAGVRGRWLSRKWTTSTKGNHYLRLDGHYFTVFPNQFRPGTWKYGIDDDFSRKSYNTEQEAKLALFEAHWPVSDDTPSTPIERRKRKPIPIPPDDDDD